MKRRFLAALALLALLLLSACGGPDAPQSSADSGQLPDPSQTEAATLPSAGTQAASEPDGSAGETQSGTAAPAQTSAEAPEPTTREPAPPTPTAPPPAPPETTEAPQPDDGPKVLSMGYYTGPYPEDGSGEAVDSVAVILVENDAEIQLQFAELHYLIDGREALFRVSELPPGEKAMVLEHGRLIATPYSDWKSDPDADLAAYLAAEPVDTLELRREADGSVSVTNRGREAAAFDLIYKQRGEDGVFLGGIAYHLRTPALAPGETQTLEAPHYTEGSEFVRVTVREP